MLHRQFYSPLMPDGIAPVGLGGGIEVESGPGRIFGRVAGSVIEYVIDSGQEEQCAEQRRHEREGRTPARARVVIPGAGRCAPRDAARA